MTYANAIQGALSFIFIFSIMLSVKSRTLQVVSLKQYAQSILFMHEAERVLYH